MSGIRPFVRVLAVVLTGALSACGPITYFSQVSRTAAAEVSAARVAGAEKLAPFEYTSAVLYLAKAHEEAGHSDWQAAIKLGRVAAEQATRARKLALGKGGPPAPAPLEEANE